MLGDQLGWDYECWELMSYTGDKASAPSVRESAGMGPGMSIIDETSELGTARSD
jgi:hypothetical protein